MKISRRFKKFYKSLIFSLSAADNAAFIAFYKYLYRARKNSLSAFLDAYSKKHSPVSFLQIGANDGFNHDPLHKFIKRDRWQGVMLEPQPDVFRQYLSRLYAKRDEVVTINAALNHTDGKTKLYKVAFSNERWATGLSSFAEEVLLQKIADGSLEARARKEGAILPASQADWIATEEIDTISPRSLLKYFESGRFDLLMIDTEGFDFEVLKMIDLDRVQPDVIIYEEINLSDDDKEACHTYLDTYGYSYRLVQKDGLCINKKRQDIIQLLDDI